MRQLSFPGEGDSHINTDGDARRNFQKKPRKVTKLGVAPANFIPYKLPRKFSFIEIIQKIIILKIIAKGQHVLL